MISVVAIGSDNTILTDYYSREEKSVAKKSMLGIDLNKFDEVPLSRLKTIVDSIDGFIILLNAQYCINKDTKSIGMDYILSSGIDLNKVYSLIVDMDSSTEVGVHSVRSWDKYFKRITESYNYKTRAYHIDTCTFIKIKLATYLVASWCTNFPPEVRSISQYKELTYKSKEELRDFCHDFVERYQLREITITGESHLDKDIDECIDNNKSVYSLIHKRILKSATTNLAAMTKVLKIDFLEKRIYNDLGFHMEQNMASEYVRVKFYTEDVVNPLVCDYLNRDKKILVVNIFAFDCYRIRDEKLKDILKKSKMIDQEHHSFTQVKELMRPEATFMDPYKEKDETVRRKIIENNEVLIKFIEHYVYEMVNVAGNTPSVDVAIGINKTYEMLYEIVKKAFKNKIYCYCVDSSKIQFIVNKQEAEEKRAFLEKLFVGFSKDKVNVYIKE